MKIGTVSFGRKLTAAILAFLLCLVSIILAHGLSQWSFWLATITVAVLVFSVSLEKMALLWMAYKAGKFWEVYQSIMGKGGG